MSKKHDYTIDTLAAAEIAAEVRRLETMMYPGGDSTPRLLGDGEAKSIEREINEGPLSAFVHGADDDPQLAFLRAKAHLAAYVARSEILKRTSAPPWLRYVLSMLLIPILLGVLVPPIVNLLTARQELKLYQEQRAFEAKRKQADVLLGHLAGIGVRARELKSSISYFETGGLSEGQAARLHGKSVELEQDYRLAVQLHHFDLVPAIRAAEMQAYSELRALQDCLLRASGRKPSADWRGVVMAAVNDSKLAEDLEKSSTSDPPCGDNFNANSFYSFTSAVDSEISRRIGGSLFPAVEALGNE